MQIALLELGGSHDECLYTQISALKSVEGIEVTLIVNESLRKNVSYFDSIDHYKYINLRSGWRQWIDIFKLSKFLHQHNFDKVVLNTASGGPIKKLLLVSPPAKDKFYGILHDISKLQRSTGQRLISSKMNGYLVLADFLAKQARTHQKDVPVSSFLPLCFPDYPSRTTVHKSDRELWICIPGQVSLDRRDYLGFIKMLAQSEIEPNTKFILLGRCAHAHGNGEEVRSYIEKYKLQSHFLMWDDFIDPEVFYAYVKQSDYIMPLIHTDHRSETLYQNQITGTFNLAFGHRIPMLIEEGTVPKSFLKDSSLYYKKDTFTLILNRLSSIAPDRFYIHEQWHKGYQAASFLKSIGL